MDAGERLELVTSESARFFKLFNRSAEQRLRHSVGFFTAHGGEFLLKSLHVSPFAQQEIGVEIIAGEP